MTYVNRILVRLLFSLCCFLSINSQASKVHLTLDEPELFLPMIKSPLEKREAQLTPQEYPLAQQLRPLLNAQQYPEVLTLLSKHIETTDEISPALYLLVAQIEMQLGDFKIAEKHFLAALAKMPDLVRAHEGLSLVYISQEAYKKAQASLINAISLGASNSQSYAQLAYLNMQLNNPVSAINAYQQALMLDPSNINIKNGLLFALMRSKQFASAGSLLDQMLLENPIQHELWIQRANLALETKDNEKALSSIEVAIRLGNKKPETYQLAAQIHLSQKNYSRAVSLLNSLIDMEELPMESFDKLLTWLLREKQWLYAEKLLMAMNRYVNDKKNSQYSNFDKSRLLHYQGVLAQSKNNIKEAEKVFKQAIDLDPSNGKSLIALAKLSVEENKVVYAELLYQRAERLDEVRLAAMLGRAQIYIDQQQYNEALTLLRKTRKAFPQRNDLDGNINTLASIVNNQA